MKLIDIQWKPSDRQLRQFAAIALLAIPLLVVFWWSGGNRTVIVGALVVAAVVGAVGLAVPRVVAPLFVGLSIVTFPMGIVVSELAMLLIYGLVFLPIALVFRLVRRDALGRRMPSKLPTYWVSKRRAENAESYYNQW